MKNVILGLTGTIGSGKSFVSSLLSRCSVPVLCADRLAREITQNNQGVLDSIRKEFGPLVFQDDGALDRKKLAGSVFSDSDKLKTLEQIIHPIVRARELEWISQNRHQPLIVLDIPLLYETEFEKECDAVAVVVVDEETRMRRLEKDRGLDRAEVSRRLARQLPQQDKAGRADHVIDNSGTRADTAHQIAAMLAAIFPAGVPPPIDISPLKSLHL